MNLRDALSEATEWVKEIGAYQLERMGGDNLRIETKSSGYDLVTEVDKTSEQRLVEKIRNSFPDHAIMGEESGDLLTGSDYRWIIDPLDGTVNYTHGYPCFGISMAIQHREQTVLGLFYLPVYHELFSAIRGEGAYLNGRRLRVSDTPELAGAILATGFPYDKAIDPRNNLDYFCRIVPRVGGIRRSGSAAYDLCNVAAGRLDGYWEIKVQLYDIAAGVLLVEEAGGKIEHLPEHPPLALIAGNERLCRQIRQEIAAVDRQHLEHERGEFPA